MLEFCLLVCAAVFGGQKRASGPWNGTTVSCRVLLQTESGSSPKAVPLQELLLVEPSLQPQDIVS